MTLMPATEMDDFRRSYVRLCKESGAEPQESILQHLEEASGKSRLDLATHTLSVETCGVLGKLLQDELQFTEITLSNCMLSEEGGALFVHKAILDFCPFLRIDRKSQSPWPLFLMASHPSFSC